MSETIKTVLAKIILAILILMITYLIGTMCSWSFNPAHWHWLLRSTLTFALILALIGIVIID